MLRKLRQRAQDEKGFTLIELLVVILIIGILAAIALPAFLNQRSKAQDANAKSAVRTAQTAMETYYTDKQTYIGATTTKLTEIEPAIADSVGVTKLNLDVGTPTKDGYTLTVTSKSSDGTKFTITNDKGTVTRGCDQMGKGGCPDDLKW